jgi:hypothetical protein
MDGVADTTFSCEVRDIDDGVVHCGLHACGGRFTVAIGERRQAHREQRRAPPTVAAARTEADRLTFDDDHPEGGVAFEEVVCVHSPVIPAPTIATSASVSPSSGAPTTRSCSGSVSDHRGRPDVGRTFADAMALR